MKFWERACGVEACGRCGTVQVEGTPVQRVKIPGVARQLMRCQVCADEPVKFAQLERRDIETDGEPWEPLRKFVAKLQTRFDAKRAAAGERED